MKKDKILKYIVAFCYIFSALILFHCIRIRLRPGAYILTNNRLFLLLLVCIFVYIAGLILVKNFHASKKLLRLNLIIYFLIYTVTIFTLTLFDEIFGRQGFVFVNWNMDLLKSYMSLSFNIIPFKTIKLFSLGYKYGLVSFNAYFTNIFGNILVFMPYGFFIPMLFKKINTYIKYLIFILLVVILIEISQFFTMSGSFDIDDIILNVLGMLIVYFITVKKYKTFIKYKNILITSFISLVITFILFELLSWYHFGDIPTIITLFRLIICFVIIEVITYFIYYSLRKKYCIR